MFNKNNHVTRLVIIALLIALEILLTRVLAINTPTMRISFGFLPPAIIGMMYGPLWAGAAYTIGDILGGYIFLPMAPFPGFTLSAFLTGLVFGLLFYNKEPSLKRCIIASALVSFIINLILDTIWLFILNGEGMIGMMPFRILKLGIMFPLMIILTYFFWKKVVNRIPGIQI